MLSSMRPYLPPLRWLFPVMSLAFLFFFLYGFFHWLLAAGLVFDVLLWGQPARAFVLRHDGVLRGYINRCAHVPVEMDWQPGA